ATGLGSPQLTSLNGGDGLAFYLCSLGGTGVSPRVSGISPSFGPTTGGNHVIITGSDFGPGSGQTFKSQVSGVYVGSVLLPAADVSVESSTKVGVVMPKAAAQDAPASPADGAGPADITVTLKTARSSRLSPKAIYDYVAESNAKRIPAVAAVSSYGGTDAGGNLVTILGSGFSATGPDKITSITFGGVPAKIDAVSSSLAVRVTVPTYHASGSPATHCATRLNPANDLCQVEVVVSNANGSSGTEKILPAYEGAIAPNATAVVTPPPGCGCEVVPQPSEYDYAPPPRVTSISTTGPPSQFASENGSTTITITGSGFNSATINGVYFGKPDTGGFADTELSTSFSYLTGTQIQMTAPSEPSTVDAAAIPVTVWTTAGLSKASSPATDATYAGTPVVSGLSTRFGPAAGGESVTVSGKAMTDTTIAQLVDVTPPPQGLPPTSFGNVYSYTIHNDKRVSLQTPAQNPGYVDLQMCTVTGCSTTSTADRMTIYPPGNPSVANSSPASGPAHGSTPVTIVGQNLGCATGVSFGAVPAASFTNPPAFLDCGQTNLIQAQAPPGQAGKTVRITVTTAESDATGFGSTKSVASAEFTYVKSTPSAPQYLLGVPGSRSVALSWKPPLTTGGDPLIGYVATASVGGVTLTTKNLSPGTLKTTFSQLTAEASYAFTVTATSHLGEGLPATVTAKPKA
ncbi:MAG TPA: IPT/TIG domain-containing protein, partial [Chloroflexota bacterium]|nr:IPT/TIG domain-containing protein [Chloroflexota bacterium]